MACKWFFVCLLLFFIIQMEVVECKKHLPLPPLFMKEIGSQAKEPSGLTYCNSTNRVYMNCDQAKCHYIYEYDTEGNFIQTLEFDSSIHDVEAIACDDINKFIYIAQEGKRKVWGYRLDNYNTHFKQKQLIPVINFSVVTKDSVSTKSGLEGMTVNTKTGDIYVANEKSPVLLIHIYANGTQYATYDVPNIRDISGLAYDDQLDLLWILSDQMEKVFLTDLTGLIIYDSWDLPVYNPEGIAINNVADPPMMYITTDPSAPGGKAYLPFLMGFYKPINGTGYSTYDKNNLPDYVTNPPPCSGCQHAFRDAVEAGFSSVSYWEHHFPEKLPISNSGDWKMISIIVVPISIVMLLLFCSILILSAALLKLRRSKKNKLLIEEDNLLGEEMQEFNEDANVEDGDDELFTL